jgi:hypothetical protein
MIIFLFSIKSYDFWPVLMAHLLLHDFLHLFIYDAAKTVRPLTSYSTKNSNRGTVLNPNKFRLDTLFNPAAPQTLYFMLFSIHKQKEEKINILAIKSKKTIILGAGMIT